MDDVITSDLIKLQTIARHLQDVHGLKTSLTLMPMRETPAGLRQLDHCIRIYAPNELVAGYEYYISPETLNGIRRIKHCATMAEEIYLDYLEKEDQYGDSSST